MRWALFTLTPGVTNKAASTLSTSEMRIDVDASCVSDQDQIISSAPITCSPNVDIIDVARKYAKDEFIERLMIHAGKNEQFLINLRSELFDTAKTRNDCPLGDLRVRRRRKVDDPLEHKLASDCYYICMFILGNTTDELLEVISNSNKSSMVTDICTPRRCDSTGPTDQSPIRGNIVFDEEFQPSVANCLSLKLNRMSSVLNSGLRYMHYKKNCQV